MYLTTDRKLQMVKESIRPTVSKALASVKTQSKLSSQSPYGGLWLGSFFVISSFLKLKSNVKNYVRTTKKTVWRPSLKGYLKLYTRIIQYIFALVKKGASVFAENILNKPKKGRL